MLSTKAITYSIGTTSACPWYTRNTGKGYFNENGYNKYVDAVYVCKENGEIGLTQTYSSQYGWPNGVRGAFQVIL